VLSTPVYEERFSTVRALQSVALSVAVRDKVLARFAALFHVYSLGVLGRVGWRHVAWSGMNEACPTAMSHVPHQRVMARVNEPCSISTCHVPCQCRARAILQRGHDPLHASCI